MKNLRSSINGGLRSSKLGGLTLLRILLAESGEKLMTQDGRLIALNR
jgi:hypothetical protein